MNNAVKVYTFLTLAFLLASSAAGMLAAPFNIIFKIAAYGVPVFVGYLVSRKFKREREEIAGVAEAESTLVGIKPCRLAGLAPLVMPTLGLIFLISYLTSLLLGTLGIAGSTVEDAPLFEMLIIHALVPSLLEEMLFRYLPMKLIAPYSRRLSIVVSSVYFALIHFNLFQIPYALVAGVIFIVIDLWADSVLPSFILHLLNNAISVLWIKYSASAEFAMWYTVILVSLSLLSLVPIVIKRKEYIRGFLKTTDKGETLTDRYALMLFVIFASLMTLMNYL